MKKYAWTRFFGLHEISSHVGMSKKIMLIESINIIFLIKIMKIFKN